MIVKHGCFFYVNAMHQNLTGTECGGVIACAKLKVVMQTLMRKSCLHQGVSSQGWMTNGKARCRVRHAINIDFVKKLFGIKTLI